MKLNIRFPLTCLAVAGCLSTAHAFTDNFDDWNDTTPAWTHYAPWGEQYYFPSQSVGAAYQMVAPAGNSSSPGRIGSYVLGAPDLTDFWVEVDLVDWSLNKRQFMGVMARVQSDGNFPGGYAFVLRNDTTGTYYGAACQMQILYVPPGASGQPTVLSGAPAGKNQDYGMFNWNYSEIPTPDKDYRLKFWSSGGWLHAQIFDKATGQPLRFNGGDYVNFTTILEAPDQNYSSGKSGLFSYVRITHSSADGVDPTFDNFYSGAAAPDTTPPTVTINQKAGQADPTKVSPINFTVVFNESVTGFATGDVTITGTAPGTKTGTVTGSGTTYNVAVTGMTGSGTVIADVPASKAQDLAGNWNTVSTSTDKTVTYDVTPPSITCPANVTVNVNAGVCYATGVAIGTATATDNSGSVTVAGDAPGTFNRGVTTVTWTATDSSGNTAACAQTVTVNDNIAPTITCPANKTVSANTGCTATGVALGSPTTGDNCGVASVGNNAPGSGSGPYPLGITAVTWTVTDTSSNQRTCSQTVTVIDSTAPTITCPANVTVVANTGCTATGVTLGSPTTGDNCGVASVGNNAPGSGTYPLGITTVTWTVTDTSSNQRTCSQTVTVIDNQAPTITCQANQTVSADANVCYATGVALGTPTTSDNCGIPSVSKTPVLTQYPKGVTTVTWTATDASGNTATCAQTVTVNDTEPPTITCPADQTVSADAGQCYATGVTLGAPATSDNCGISTVTNNAPAQFNSGVTTVTWTAVDTSGNLATCSQSVTLNDTEAPTITCPADVTTVNDAGQCFATGVSLGVPSATNDNCGILTVTNDAPAQFNSGVTTVTWTAVDNSGNLGTCAQSVMVEETEAPTISAPVNLTIAADAGLCYATGVALGTPGTSDNCGILTVTNNAPGAFNSGVTTVIWTAVDTSGNLATGQQNVTVITQPGCTMGCTVINVALGSPVTGDNCSVASVANDAPVVYPLGTNFVTWTVTDASGNTATTTQRVIVEDLVAPTITCPANLTVSANDGNTATNVALGSPVTGDNCSVASVANDAPAAYPLGANVVTWTVTDGSGNTATNVQTVTVIASSLCELAISYGGGIVTINWDGVALQQAENVLGSYEDILGAAKPYIIGISGPQQFYRVRCQ